METLKIVKMFDDVKLPEKKTPTDSGFDVYAYSFQRYYQNFDSNMEREFEGEKLKHFIRDNSIEMACWDRLLIGTGLKMTVGPGYEIQVRTRSGLALKNGLAIANSPGTVDEKFRDQVCLILVNLSRKVQIVKLGERLAQLVVCPVLLPEIEVVQTLPEGNRGGGLGHTGK
jgi:dUTP pyrophosphatase